MTMLHSKQGIAEAAIGPETTNVLIQLLPRKMLLMIMTVTFYLCH